MSCVASVTSAKLFHKCKGHPNLSKLKQMVLGCEKLQVLDCESCQLGKHVCSSFPKQMEKRCNSSFFIFHLDIWGPSRVFFFGFKYCHFYWWIFSMHLVVLILFIMSLQDSINSLLQAEANRSNALSLEQVYWICGPFSWQNSVITSLDETFSK